MYELETPQSAEEKMAVVALDLIMDMQYAVQAAMTKNKITQIKLSKLMHCSPSNISQMLADDANPKIETIAKALAVMNEKFVFASESLHGEWITTNFNERVSQLRDFFVKNNNSTKNKHDLRNFNIIIENEIKTEITIIKTEYKKANDDNWLNGPRVRSFAAEIPLFKEAA